MVSLSINVFDEVSPRLRAYEKQLDGRQLNRVIGAIGYGFKKHYKRDIQNRFGQKTGKGLKRISYDNVRRGKTEVASPFPYRFFEEKTSIQVKSARVLSDGSTVFGTDFELPYRPVIRQSFNAFVGSGQVQRIAEEILNKVIKEAGLEPN